MPSGPVESAERIGFVGWCDLGGRPDAMQIMVHRGYGYVAHLMNDGFSVVDLHDPATPRIVGFVPAPPRTRSIHLQAHGDLLLVANGGNAAEMRAYATAEDGSRYAAEAGFFAGMRVYDIAHPEQPREIGTLRVEGLGIHRIWYAGGRYATASAHFHDVTDHILVVIDMADPTAPRIVGRWALPGMRRDEAAVLPPGQRVGLHHAIVAGNFAYGAWRHGGLTMHDISDPSAPRLLAHRRFGPPFTGSTHTALPLPERGLLVVADEPTAANGTEGIPLCRMFDTHTAGAPELLGTLPTPNDADYIAKGGKFGAHNLHENRPGSAMRSDIVFATFHNAGLRVYDISEPATPREIAHFVPAPAAGAPVIQSCDVYVDPSGLIYVTDTGAGLFVLSYEGQ